MGPCSAVAGPVRARGWVAWDAAYASGCRELHVVWVRVYVISYVNRYVMLEHLGSWSADCCRFPRTLTAKAASDAWPRDRVSGGSPHTRLDCVLLALVL